MDKLNCSVESRSRDQIERLAAAVRQVFRLGSEERVAMLPLLEIAMPELLPDYEFMIVPDEMIRGKEAVTDLGSPIIRFSEHAYEELRKGDARARFTAAHELGHLLMHSSSRVHYARSIAYDRSSDPEWQANAFAAALLMPEQMFRQMKNTEEAMATFGVGYKAANFRASVLRHRWGKKKERKNVSRAP